MRVDNATGVVDVVPVYTGHTGVPEAVTRYLLTHYVTVCERFNYATAESDYEECGAFHTAQRNQAWYALWNPTNPASPLNVYKDGTTVRAQVVVRQLLQARERRRRSRPGALRQGEARRGQCDVRKRPTGSPRSSTSTPIPRPTPRSGAGIRSASRSWISGPSLKC